MHFPLIAALVAIALVLLKVVTLGGILVALMIMAPLLLAFLIVGVVIFAILGAFVGAARFIAFCARGFRPAPRPVPPFAGTPVPPPHAPAYAARYAQVAAQARPAWVYRRRGSRMRGVAFVVAMIALVFVLSSKHRPSAEHAQIKFDQVQSKLDQAMHKLERTFQRNQQRWSRAHGHPPMPRVPEEPAEPDEPSISDEMAGAMRAEAVHAAESDPSSASWKVLGWGETREDAYQDAVKRANLVVQDYLKEQEPPITWKPPAGYVKEHLVKRQTQNGTRDLGQGIGRVQEVELTVRVAPEDMKLIMAEEHNELMEERMWLAGKVLAGVVAFLGAVAVYIRLDEYTRGYYTGWLRLAALSVVASAAAVLWLLPV